MAKVRRKKTHSTSGTADNDSDFTVQIGGRSLRDRKGGGDVLEEGLHLAFCEGG